MLTKQSVLLRRLHDCGADTEAFPNYIREMAACTGIQAPCNVLTKQLVLLRRLHDCGADRESNPIYIREMAGCTTGWPAYRPDRIAWSMTTSQYIYLAFESTLMKNT